MYQALLCQPVSGYLFADASEAGDPTASPIFEITTTLTVDVAVRF
jgi:hypothetical protein